MLFIPSPNFNARAEGKIVRHLIVHYTETENRDHALSLLCGTERQVSAHYYVDVDGTVIQLVDEKNRAWHAGKSWWEGETDINSTSIGIEIENKGHSRGYHPFPVVQVEAVKRLCVGILERHAIQPWHVLAHSDIAPDRKIDPGELFPWRALAQEGIGLWPNAAVGADSTIGIEHEEGIKALLVRYGYDRSLPAKLLISAFQRHFEPQVFEKPEAVGIPTAATLNLIKALLVQSGKEE